MPSIARRCKKPRCTTVALTCFGLFFGLESRQWAKSLKIYILRKQAHKSMNFTRGGYLFHFDEKQPTARQQTGTEFELHLILYR